eukprot:Rmarinus@m.27928
MALSTWILTRFTRYRRPKMVEYQDPSLAIAYWFMFFVIVGLYTGLYQLSYLHAYALYESPAPTFNIWIDHIISSNATEFEPYCDPSNEFYTFGETMTLEEKAEVGFYLNEGAQCINMTAERHSRVGSTSMSITTFEMIGGPSDANNLDHGRPRYYVRDVEGVVIGFGVDLSTTWMSEAVQVKNFRLFAADGQSVEPFAVTLDGFFLLTVEQLFEMSGVSLLGTNSVSPAELAPRRMTGASFTVRFECTNLRPFDWHDYNTIRCDVSIATSTSSWGNIGSRVVLEPPEKDAYTGEPTYSLHMGLIFNTQVSGMLGQFETQALVRVLVDALVLLTTAGTLLNFVCENFLPGSLSFVSAFREQVRLRIFKKTAPEDPQAMGSPNKWLEGPLDGVAGVSSGALMEHENAKWPGSPIEHFV